MATRNMLDTRRGRLTTFGILYICEGLPLGFATIALAAYMRRTGMDVAQVGAFIGSFYLPWAFKWAWAPLIDLIGLRRVGGRKAWIVICQVLMIITLYGVSQIDYARHFDLLIMMVIVHNIFAATCDVAIDSLAVNSLRADELGQGNGVMFAGAYIGQGLGGGGALFISGMYGFDISFLYVSALLCLVLAFVIFFVKDPTAASAVAEKSSEVWQKFRASLAGFMRELQLGFFKSGKGPLVGVFFALLPFGAMALGSGVSTALQVDIGMTDNHIAQLNIYNTAISGFGCVLGGWLADRLGKRKMLALFYGLTLLPTLYLAVAIGGESGVSGITIPQFFVASLAFSMSMGMHYGTSAAIFMGLTNPAIAATQFTGFMALRNLTISYTNTWQGAAVDAWGYSVLLYADAAIAIIPILVIPFLVGRKAKETPPSLGAPLPEAG
jgi:PAT family beta-lactamase induction signal transducer AmpG